MASQFPADRKSPVALIVEDDPDLRELSAALMEETDLRVVECVDAEAAMTFLAHEGRTLHWCSPISGCPANSTVSISRGG